jgi:hypothetical protein
MAIPVCLLVTLLSGVARAESAQPAEASPPKHTRSMSVHGIADLSLVFSQVRGTQLDGRHAQLLDANHIAFLPKLSAGFGVRPSAGVLLAHVLPSFSISASGTFEYSRYQAISYNYSNTWYEHQDAKLYDLGLELRALLDMGALKPFVEITPGYAWLKLPNGITATDANNVVSWSDLTLRGFSFEASPGLRYALFDFLAVDASFGVRLHGLNSSNGPPSSVGMSTGWVARLGIVGML